MTHTSVVRRCKLEDDASKHSREVGDTPLPHATKLSAAPTREASFVHENSERIKRPADVLLFGSPEDEVVPLNVPCQSCGMLITGALYMGYDRAYCSTAACH